MQQFIKPSVKFPLFPFIYAYIELAYNKVETMEDYVSFVNYCLNEAETTKNDVKRAAYNSVASVLYSLEVGKTFESKEIELKIMEL
jgi:hypothetical protein